MFHIQCIFSGWALSMDETDSFFHKLGNKDPFGGDSTPNPKTLGVLVVIICFIFAFN